MPFCSFLSLSIQPFGQSDIGEFQVISDNHLDLLKFNEKKIENITEGITNNSRNFSIHFIVGVTFRKSIYPL